MSNEIAIVNVTYLKHAVNRHGIYNTRTQLILRIVYNVLFW